MAVMSEKWGRRTRVTTLATRAAETKRSKRMLRGPRSILLFGATPRAILLPASERLALFVTHCTRGAVAVGRARIRNVAGPLALSARKIV
jgi:hypothetical protein